MPFLAIFSIFVMNIEAANYFSDEWTWQYCYVNTWDLRYEEYSFDFYSKFQGTTTLGGYEWHNFTVVGYDAKHGLSGEIQHYNQQGLTFLIREENKKFYMRLPEDGSFDFQSVWEIGEDGVMICDFNCDQGDTFETFGNNGLQMTAYVESVRDVDIAGETRKVFFTCVNCPESYIIDEDYVFVEGIGPASHGYLCYLQSVWMNSMPPMYSSSERMSEKSVTDVGHFIFPPIFEEITFKGITDSEGNLILDSNMIGDGIPVIKDSDAPKNGHVYDVFGRVVDTPQSGTIYIQNGHKYFSK